MFNQKGFVVSLRPYLALTQAVRQGDLVEFNRIVKEVRFEWRGWAVLALVFCVWYCCCLFFTFVAVAVSCLAVSRAAVR